jgi:hypothetical protein
VKLKTDRKIERIGPENKANPENYIIGVGILKTLH